MVSRLLKYGRIVTSNAFGKLVPGLLLIAALVTLAILLTNAINRLIGLGNIISFILIVIIIGMAINNFWSVPRVFKCGIAFAVKRILRLGIILMGIRLSIVSVLTIGVWGIPIVLSCILAGLVVTVYFGKWLKIPIRLALLTAVGTGICGVTAIVATAPGLEAQDEEVSYAVANITVFGLIAMVVYPLIMHTVLDGQTTLIGLFLGTGIHETAQVAAAGMIYDQTFNVITSPTVLDVATVTKLLRNVMMAVVIPAITIWYSARIQRTQVGKAGRTRSILRLFPLFIFGFLAMAILRSIGDYGLENGGQAFGLWEGETWKAIFGRVSEWSGYLLAAAMAGVGLSTSFRQMKGFGIRPFYVGFVAALSVGVVGLIMVLILGRYVTV
jgi:uncharacterized integral membrane protein (TIGR00698 family)